ncbi:glutamate--cysteine ligase catalytic subunit [Plakobranchus ocellatus]|uniref:Glutamate--cysteine ligase n=1 Tax=Plakobranchus ocellatus TaxID=259542 RepID=A0AAV4D8L8_9GAST|nr:glutamate--cysteine ligase catalytic subunit [Plakobranchus ocellatus]
MGLLSEGTPLSWEETKAYADHVRKHGIQQFLAQYHKLASRQKDILYWGDEVEYQLVKFDHKKKKTFVSLRGTEVLSRLREKGLEKPDTEASTSWHVEYAEYMVEGTPGAPYGGLIAHFNVVEANMALRYHFMFVEASIALRHYLNHIDAIASFRYLVNLVEANTALRRREIMAELEKDEVPLSQTVYPLLGVGEFTSPPAKPDPVNSVSRSLFFPDEAISQNHVRFKTLTRNIRHRRKEKVAINIPIFKDVNTPSPFVEDFSALGDDGSSAAAALPDHIYMDAMGFGMGNSCLQVTFQACNLSEARTLYDQLAGMCPIMLALSASSPIFRGYLSDIDTRWPVIAASVDDRTREERGLEPLKENKYRINKSRYDSIDSYISPLGTCYNDIDLTIDEELCKTLIDGGVEVLLARHIAHLFIRDPVSLFSERLDQDDDNDTDHFENIQSTNWQTMRFKPPPPKSNIGWRVEFRPMEAQFTDFENAAFTVFIVLLTRVILSYKLNLLIPISKVDENMKTAFKRDAVLNDKFYFRKDVVTDATPPECVQQCGSAACNKALSNQYELMTMNEIFQGKDEFPGLVPLINLYLQSIEVDVDTRCTITQYLKLISLRASGELETSAHWMRNFVMNHKLYRHDSVVPEGTAYDLLTRVAEISSGKISDPCHLFPHIMRSARHIPEALSNAEAYLEKKSRKTHSGSKLESPRSSLANGESNGDSENLSETSGSTGS